MRETIKVVFENYLKVCVFWTHAYAYMHISYQNWRRIQLYFIAWVKAIFGNTLSTILQY